MYDIETDYMAALIDKHNRLDKIDSNRLLLIGGSNLAFGIDSEMIEKRFNVNVVNLGLHAGLGFDFIMNEAIASVKKGDVIVLSLEYALYDESSNNSFELINHIQNMYPESAKYYDPKFKDIFFLWLENAKKRFNNQEVNIDPVYNRKAFNKYGDVVGHLIRTNPKNLKDKGALKKINIDGHVELFRDLQLKCKVLGAKVYIAFPNYPASEFKINKNVILELEEQIRLKLAFIPIINKPQTFVLEDSLFFDTVFHLNAKGRHKRTEMFIKVLESNVYLAPK